jgi:hypothetical protein
MWGFDGEFTTSNYGLTTTPRREYEISTGQRVCPEEEMQDKQGRRVRIIRRIKELKLLKLCQKACLTDDEILAVVRALNQKSQLKMFRSTSRLRPNKRFSNATLVGPIFRTYVSGVQHDSPWISSDGV